MNATINQYLLKIGAVKLSPNAPFTWASGKKSPIYCDNRLTLSYPEVRRLICQSFVDKIKENFKDVEVIAGVATGGIAHGALVAEALGLPMIYVRDKPKGHGRMNLIEGHLEAGKRVVVIEDLISTGGSSLKAVDGIRESGGNVLGLLAIFTYGFEAAIKAFEAANCPFDTLTNFKSLLEELKAQNAPESEIAFMENWIKLN
jgi:orotate phosphoribosyltransferase